ncbi:MAG: ABC transporter permease [candidate division KSB1 bacterium]|nr:ABC transporter permease [candidate division KSB1 bacterium]MDZ7273201.1 ABC transporter permease [candidate division KSB1 bacterium]MDZ7285303.1 ABC transporter permease [candidate division KSB1 bacterium]MDZ7298335.1 ABC transporter permease [candidate division KSB1 bacterium]MDZ7349032.1 ABC transporter permease [candidate division KSB1 bacterium]
MIQMTSFLSEYLQDLRSQKLRTVLTIFGIIWGTVAIIVLLAFGTGFKKQLAINMHGIGESIAIMFPGRTTRAFEGFGLGRPISLREEDAWLLAEQVRGLRALSPEYSGRHAPVRVEENILNPLISGVYPVYADMRNIIVEPGGRFFNELDLRHRRRVAVIGNKVREFLFGEQEAVGQLILVGQTPFTVIGVMQKKTQNSSYNARDQDRVFIPASTFASVFGTIHLNNIIYQPLDPTRSEAVNTQVREVLGRKYKFDPTDKNAVWIWDTAEMDKFLHYFFLAFNLFLGLIGSMTLAVGGIGVANIMYVVVQERVREIGIKRAVGATRRSILLQFFMETFFIIALGAAIGFLIAYLLILGLQFIPIRDFVGTPELSPEVVAITVLILGLIGLAAGLMPARRAAHLNVVDCLRA